MGLEVDAVGAQADAIHDDVGDHGFPEHVPDAARVRKDQLVVGLDRPLDE